AKAEVPQLPDVVAAAPQVSPLCQVQTHARQQKAVGLELSQTRSQDGNCSSQRSAYGLAARIMLNGVSAARCTRLKPPEVMTLRSLASPAWAPSPAPTS